MSYLTQWNSKSILKILTPTLRDKRSKFQRAWSRADWYADMVAKRKNTGHNIDKMEISYVLWEQITKVQKACNQNRHQPNQTHDIKSGDDYYFYRTARATAAKDIDLFRQVGNKSGKLMAANSRSLSKDKIISRRSQWWSSTHEESCAHFLTTDGQVSWVTV